jgi:hypothetical protein
MKKMQRYTYLATGAKTRRDRIICPDRHEDIRSIIPKPKRSFDFQAGSSMAHPTVRKSVAPCTPSSPFHSPPNSVAATLQLKHSHSGAYNAFPSSAMRSKPNTAVSLSRCADTAFPPARSLAQRTHPAHQHAVFGIQLLQMGERSGTGMYAQLLRNKERAKRAEACWACGGEDF